MKSRIALLLVALLLSAIVSPAQSPQDKQDKEDSIVLRANEVVLDVVVRDKKGHAIKDLKQSDIEVYEDSVRQDLTSFRLVSREPGETRMGPKSTPTTTAPAPAGPREPFSNINLIAMVFDHLSPNARNLANKAAISFVDESLKPDDLTTVCLIDNSLKVIQQYTNDPQLLKEAVNRATTMAISNIETRSAERRTTETRGAAISDSSSTAVTGGAGNSGSAAGAAIGAAAVEQAFLTMQQRALETFETLERTQYGRAQINSLLAIINSMRDAPGRKAIVLFSEGLSMPPDVKIYFPAVINAANRANVSIYTVESGGLRVESNNAEAAREIKAMGERRGRQQASGRADTSGRPMTMQLERNEDILTLNPQSGLSELANSTGGFLIADTNDLSVGLRRVDEDLRTHYVVTYVPKNSNLDGRFRQISVKFGRGGLEAQTRKGYYALPSTGSSPVLEYEAAALAAIGKASQTSASPLRSMAFNFPEQQREGLTTVLAEVPANIFTYTPSTDKKTFSTDYTIVALIKNDAQQVISKLSKHYTLSGPVEGMEAARRGEVLFYKEERLPPGSYVIETAAYDAPSGKVSVHREPFEVAASNNGKMRLSSIVVLKRADRLTAEEQKQPNPFHYGELLIYPNLGEAISKAGMKQLPFFFNVYMPQGVKAAPKLSIEVMQDGKSLARLQSELPAPDPAGLIQYASAIPLDSFQTGNYELKITVNDSAATASRSIVFTIAR